MFDQAKLVSCFSITSYYLFCASIVAGMSSVITLFACILILPYAFHVTNLKHENTAFAFLAIFLIIGSLLNLLVSNNGIGGTLVIIGVLYMSRFIIENVRKMTPHILIFLIVYMSFIAYRMFIIGADPNEIYESMSRNYIGLIIVLLNSLYSFLLYIDKRRPPLLIPTISMVMVFFLFGRSSIIAMLGIIFLNLAVYLKRVRTATLIAILLAGSIGVIYSVHVFLDLYDISPFSSYGFDSPRYQMWVDFFENVSLYTFIMGMDTFSVHSIAIQNGNVHNEFLNLLARTGIGFVAFGTIFLCSLFSYLRKNRIYTLIIILIISFRIFYDTGIFVSNLGFCFYSIILYPFFYNENSANGSSDLNVDNE